MTIHPPDCDCDSYGCVRRREGLFSLSSAATPTRKRRQPYRDPATVNHNSWERGVAGEHRPDGSFMPYLHGNGGRIHLGEYSENRGHLDEVRRQQVAGEPSSTKVS